MHFCCYFIVEHSCDPEYIHQQAVQLLMSQCFGFYFFGMYSKKWVQEFRMVENTIYPNAKERRFLKQWDRINDFADALHEILSCRPLFPHDTYLIYDDLKIYQEVLAMLGVASFN